MPNVNLSPAEYRSPEVMSQKTVVPLAEQDGEYHPIGRSAFGLKVAAFSGVASGGSNTTIVDATKNFGTDTLNGKIVRVVIGDKEYIRAITDTADSTLTVGGFNTPVTAEKATCSVVKEGAGNVTVTTKADGPYTGKITLVDGTVDGALKAAVAEDGDIVVTSAFAESAAVTITAANLAALFVSDAALAALFTAEVTASGNLDTGVTEYSFTGGAVEVAAIVCAAGCEYEVVMSDIIIDGGSV